MTVRWALLGLCALLPPAAAQRPLYPPLQPAWQVEAEFGFYATPVVAGGVVYAGSRDGHLYAVNAADGTVRWRVDLGGRVYGRPLLADGVLYATSEAGRVVALDPESGAERWRRDTGGVYYAGPQLAGEVLVVGTGDSGRILGLARADGGERWSYQLGGRLGAALVAAGGRVYCPSYDQRLHVLDAATGQLAWSFQAAGIVDSPPLVAGETVFVKLPDDTVHALAADDGTPRWTFTPQPPAAAADQTSNWSPLALRGDLLVFGSQADRLVALDVKTGRPRWVTPRAAAQPAPPAFVGEVGYVGGRDGTLAALDPASGRIYWRWTPADAVEPQLLSGIMWPPAVADGMLFAASCDGHLYAFRGSADPDGWREAARREEALSTLLAGNRVVRTLIEQAPDQYKLTFQLPPPGTWPRDASAGVAFDVDGSNAGYVLLAEPAGLRLMRHQGPGDEVLLGRVPLPGGEQGFSVTVQRERGLIRLLCDNQEALAVGDQRFAPGRVLIGSRSEALTLDEVDLQPTEAVWFTDDFMRAKEDRGDWRVLSGDWSPSGVSQDDTNGDKRPEADKSANPFAYRAKQPTQRALAACGYWFWDTYRSTVAVRATGRGIIGLAGYLQDAGNYLAFEWAAAGRGGEQQLVAHVGGERRVLATADGGWQQNQWYELGLELNGGTLEVTVDGQPRLVAETNLLGQGGVGLLAEGVAWADFDDARVVGSEDLYESFSGQRPGRWQGTGGAWRVESDSPGDRDPGVVANHGAPGLLLAAGRAWDDAEIRCAGKVAPGAGLGLVAGLSGPGDYVALRWGGTAAPAAWRGKLQLVRVSAGGETVLGERDGAPAPGTWHLLALRLHDGWIQARVAGEQVFEAFDPSLGRGGAGLLAAGERTVFDRLRVESILPPPRVEFTEQFTQEDTMAGWARPAGSWLSNQVDQRGGVIWHRGLFRGDAELTVDAQQVRSGRGPLQLILAGDGARPDSGYRCAIERGDGDQATARLETRGTPVASQAFAIGETGALRFVRRGRLLALYADESPVLAWFDGHATGEPGAWVGVRREAGGIDLDRIDAGAPNLYDTTFVTAPVAWSVGKGTWQTINRWKCDPRWSFFGGYDDLNPVIWTKADYGGEQQLEAWLAIKMKDGDGDARYRDASDLCLVLCGDGRDLLSGYTFQFAAEDNTCALLWKDGKLLGRNDSRGAIFAHISTDDEGTREFHRHWFHLVLRRAGGRIIASCDDRVLFDLEDPDPLPGGKAGLFTVQNGVMVSRAKLWYERPLPPQPFVDRDALLAGADVGERDGLDYANAFETGIGAFQPLQPNHPVLLTRERDAAEGEFGLEISNLVSGGEFGVLAVDRDFPLRERPKLSFDYRVPPDVAVNLHVKVADRWYQVRFTGAAEAAPGSRVIGDLGARADGRWHSASLDLAEALKGAGVGDGASVQRLAFAMLEAAPYRQAGFGVNPQMATWHLDNWRLGL